MSLDDGLMLRARDGAKPLDPPNLTVMRNSLMCGMRAFLQRVNSN